MDIVFPVEELVCDGKMAYVLLAQEADIWFH
jgi:hypothetical protein